MEWTLTNRLIFDLQQMPLDRQRLQAEQSPLVRHWLERKVVDMERLLAQLSDQERRVIKAIVIRKERPAILADETGLTVRQISQKRDYVHQQQEDYFQDSFLTQT